MSFRFAFVVALGVSGVVFACSGSGSSGGGAAATDAQSFINELCSLYAPCCGKVNKPTDGAQCRAVYGAFTGGQQYDNTAGNACLNEIRAQSSTPTFCDNPGSGAPSCKTAFKEGGGGTKQPGEDCSQDGDCASSAEGSVTCASSYSGSAVTKSCQLVIEGKDGDKPCLATRDGNITSFTTSFGGDGGATRPPARGYVCDLALGIFCNSKTTTCTKLQDVGGECTPFASQGCVTTAYCSKTTSKCAARIPIGEDCTFNSEACVAKATCDQKTKKCAPGLETGAACTVSSDCASNQCVNRKCDKSSGGDFSTQLICGGK